MKKVYLMTIVMLVSYVHMFGQGKIVKGKVSDKTGSPMPGVSILVQGTTTATATNEKGEFEITVPATEAETSKKPKLVFSFIGSKPLTVDYDADLSNLVLEDDISELNEVVVTALDISREKKSLGFSVTEVKSGDIENTRQTNVVNALTAKVAGVRVVGSNGMVGSGSNIFIRGFTSFNSSNQPLFVVDGIPIDNYNSENNVGGDAFGNGNQLQAGVSNSNRAIDLNPDDIESMSVLKGPAAAVLYGSRAASGAILITTKKGQKGQKNTIDFTSNYNFVEVNRFPDYQTQYAQGTGGVFGRNSQNSWGPLIAGQTVTNFEGNQEVLKSYANNVQNIFQKGHNIQNSINFKGGTDKSTYMFSYSNTQETGVLANNNLNRNTFRITANTELTKRLTTGVSLQYINTTSQRTQQGNQQSNPLFRGWFLPKNIDLSNYSSTKADGTSNYFDATTDNPLWTINNNLYNDAVNRVIGNVNFKYTVADWLDVTYKLGTDAYAQNVYQKDAIGAIGGNFSVNQAGGIGYISFWSQQTSSYLNLNFHKKLGSNFNFNGLLGNEINANYSDLRSALGSGTSIPTFGNIGNSSIFNATDNVVQSRLIGFYAQAELSYKDYLYLTLTGREDKSSTFAKANNTYFYPSAALSFILTEAVPSLKSNVLSYAKLRTNIAYVGRQAPAYATGTYYATGGYAGTWGDSYTFPFNGQQSYQYQLYAGNPNLKPEFTRSAEIGGEFKFFNNRLFTDIAYFDTRTTDVIINGAVSAPISAASGFQQQTRNAGELHSYGVEWLLGGSPIKTKDFTWNISANFTSIRNMVVSIDPTVSSIFLGGFNSPQSRLEAGQPYGVFYANDFYRDKNGALIIDPSTGSPIQNTSTLVKVGNPNPDWTAGLTNSFSYKGFSLSFLIDIRKGGDIISRNYRDLRYRGAAAETGNRTKDYINDGVSAQLDGSGNVVTDASGNPVVQTNADGSEVKNDVVLNAQHYYQGLWTMQGANMVFDGSWVRLRELSVSYNFPKKWFGKTPIGNLSLSLVGRNLLLYTPNYKDFDPETNSQGVSNSQGIEFNGLPQTRTYGAVMRVTF